jgi:hypothetical protein
MRNRLARASLIVGLAVIPLSASTFSFSGVFAEDDSQFLTGFNLAGNATVNLESYSYGGGIDPLNGSVPAGGFATVLSLFDSSGNLLAFDDGGTAPGGCAPRTIDPATGFCLDAYLQEDLSPGSYTVVLTEYDNTPNGPTLADGFAKDGQGNFTGPEFLGVPGSFIDPFGNQRTDAYDFNISGINSLVPEPSSAASLAAALLLLFAFSHYRVLKARRV